MLRDDLAERLYKLPANLPTDLRPDLVVHSPGRVHIFELTVCWEANLVRSRLRKESKYLHLLYVARGRGTQPTYTPSRSAAEVSWTLTASSHSSC